MSGNDTMDFSVSEPLEVLKELTKWVKDSESKANILRTMQVRLNYVIYNKATTTEKLLKGIKYMYVYMYVLCMYY